ncbi:hypothetical protein JCGZ_18385 [Jatropha curcas]|uniref:Uncharacterized protein n=1 Tax=Jatropha curcas TaxID=180498 RepID=A0A067KCU6_JATCU|nr:hypothetical protein JCGZ_18385 [Jatropha curcas]
MVRRGRGRCRGNQPQQDEIPEIRRMIEDLTQAVQASLRSVRNPWKPKWRLRKATTKTLIFKKLLRVKRKSRT